jgi:HK97 family phage prohead protease
MDTLTLPDLDIVRTTLVACSWRAKGEADETNDDDGLGVMDVRFSPFNTWYRIDSVWEGSFLERTVPGTFKRTISAHNAATKVDSHSVKTLFNHGLDFNIGDKLLGDIVEMKEDADSPRSTVRLWDTSYNRDLLPGLRSGAYGSSFMFRVIKEEWNDEPGKSDHNPDGIPERTVKEARVFEAGPVTWPASPTASAGMRCTSATDAYYDHLARRDPHRVEALRSKLFALRGDGRPASGTRPADGPANARPTDSANSHSGGLTHAQRRARLHPYLTGAIQ